MMGDPSLANEQSDTNNVVQMRKMVPDPRGRPAAGLPLAVRAGSYRSSHQHDIGIGLETRPDQME